MSMFSSCSLLCCAMDTSTKAVWLEFLLSFKLFKILEKLKKKQIQENFLKDTLN